MTTNEMIYKTISTKLTKTPIYKSVLEDLGYEVFDSTWSSYNNWAVKNKKTGRVILFSKGYDNKRRLYDNATSIKAGDFKKVNYVDYLSKNKSTINQPYFEKPTEYHGLRVTIRGSKSSIKFYEGYIREKQKEVEKINDEIKRCREQVSDYQNKLNNARERVKELRGC